MPTYKYNRDLEFALSGIQKVHDFYFADKAYCRILTPLTAQELLAYVAAIRYYNGHIF